MRPKMKKLEVCLPVLVILGTALVTNAQVSDFHVASDFYDGSTYGFHGDNVAFKGNDRWVRIKNLTTGQVHRIDSIWNDVVDLSASYVTAFDSGPGSPRHIWVARINPDGSLASGLLYIPPHFWGSSWAPSIYDNLLVWQSNRGGSRKPWDIYMATLDGGPIGTEDVRRLTNNEGSSHNLQIPRIYGDNVFWQRRHPNNSTVFGLDGKNILTGETFLVHSGPASPDDIYEDKIVYSANADIYIFDIPTRIAKKITDDSFSQYSPNIYGNTVVWQDDRNGNFDIYAYDLVTEQETQITDNEFDQKQPKLFGNTVLWVDYRNGVSLYGAIVPPPVTNLPPVADAGGDQTVAVGDKVCMDGNGSSDPDEDELTYMWGFIVPKPDGCSCVFDDPMSPTPCFDANVVGRYNISLVVSDGELSSVPNIVTITAITLEEAVAQVQEALAVALSEIPEDNLSSHNAANVMIKDIGLAINMALKGKYTPALNKLNNNILKRTDGCEVSGAVDGDDWILTCEDQEIVWPLVTRAIELVERMMDL